MTKIRAYTITLFAISCWLASFDSLPDIVETAVETRNTRMTIDGNLQQLPDWYLDIKPKTSNVAVMAIDITQNRILVSDNAGRAMLPASVQKLMLAVAAVTGLDQNFRFRTRLYSSGVNRHHADALHLEFNGDPTLTSADLANLLSKVTQSGIKSVTRLYLSAQVQTPLKAPGWTWDDLAVCYGATISDFILDQNCIKASLAPSLDGKNTDIRLPVRYGVSISNEVILRLGASEADCRPELSSKGANDYRLYGCYRHSQTLPLAIAVNDPAAWVQAHVITLLGTLGISVKEIVTKASTADVENTEHRQLLNEHMSQPLMSLLTVMLKSSDNMVADALLKQLGKDPHHGGDFYRGNQTMEHLLGQLGIDLTNANLVDGSGLSRYNLLTAAQLMRILLLMHQRPELKPLISALPIAGIDGTLANRRDFTRPPLKGAVFAKTGSMLGVTNLAGYIRHNSHEYAFVVLENGLVRDNAEQNKKHFIAEFLNALITYGESG